VSSGTTVVAGIEIPSTFPVFLVVVAFHVLMGLAWAPPQNWGSGGNGGWRE
jgi:hypothetical protein